MADEYIRKQDMVNYCKALMNAEVVQKTDNWGYGKERYNQTEVILNFIENCQPADVISKANMITLLEKTEREVLKGINRYSTPWIMIDSIFKTIRCMVNMLGEKTDG